MSFHLRKVADLVDKELRKQAGDGFLIGGIIAIQ